MEAWTAKGNPLTYEFVMNTHVQSIAAGDRMAPGVNAQKHVEEGLDLIPGQLNKRQKMEEARAWEVQHEPYPVMNIAAQLTANGENLVDGEDVAKHVEKVFKLKPAEWYDLQNLGVTCVPDILPNHGLAMLKNAQWTASGVIIAPGARVVPHVGAVSRDDPNTYKGLQLTVEKNVLARPQNLGIVEKIIVQSIVNGMTLEIGVRVTKIAEVAGKGDLERLNKRQNMEE